MTFYQNAPRILNPPQSTTLPHLAPSPNSGSPASEEGYGTAYMPVDKGDGDYTVEEDTTLTAQTLNADGTPKRPMNAFMIFARKRRPQLSAENQSMRTGEISKILSKEWNSMPPSEKQYFQDQAKFLKDSFNNKYPDYVYRRRPNNTRKKRKTDGVSTGLDVGDAYGAGEENKEPSDGDDLALPPPSNSSSRSYPYPQADPLYRQNAGHDHRGGYSLVHDRADSAYRSNSGGVQRTVSPHTHTSLNPGPGRGYPPYSSSSPSSYPGSDPPPSSGAPGWTETGRMPLPSASGWYAPDRAGSYSSGPPPPQGGGGRFSSSQWPEQSPAPGPHSSNYNFPTLNSPFYPPGGKGDSASGGPGGGTYTSSPADSPSASYPEPRYGGGGGSRGGYAGGGGRYVDDSPNLPHSHAHAEGGGGGGGGGADLYPSGQHRGGGRVGHPHPHPSHSPTGSEASNHAASGGPPSHPGAAPYSYWPGDRGEH